MQQSARIYFCIYLYTTTIAHQVAKLILFVSENETVDETLACIEYLYIYIERARV